MNAAAVRPLALLAAPVVAAALVAVAWQGSSVGASRPAVVRVQDRVQTRVETKVQTQMKVVQDTNAVAELGAQIAALQQAVTATAQGMTAQVATLKQTITSLQGTISTLQQGVATAQGNNAAQTKKVTDLTTTLTGVDQRLVALQSLVNDTLLKLRVSPSPTPAH
jgi:chromosome segregation ATPase